MLDIGTTEGAHIFEVVELDLPQVKLRWVILAKIVMYFIIMAQDMFS
jgi:hypothetical protein